MDTYVLEKSMNGESASSLIFEQKNWIAIPDSNASQYSSNKVNFVLDNIGNSATDYFNFQESFVQIPLNLSIKFVASTGTAPLLTSITSIENNFMASLKSGSYNIIDKINYKLNGNEIITNDNYENIKINYKILTSWSSETVQKRGDELYFAKDDVLTTNWSSTYGIVNTSIKPATTFGAYYSSPNLPRLARMRKTSFNYLSSVQSLVGTNNTKINGLRQDFCQLDGASNGFLPT
jgi:hypothetical protein